MKLAIAAALALIPATTLAAQTVNDLGIATPIAGSWRYGSTGDGSEAAFVNESGGAQLWIHCTRATRRVSIAKRAGGAAPFLNFWTSSLTRTVRRASIRRPAA